ncbi:MAG: PQQ-binding-like beta-propeller repeat protein, partial [Verrucomicrobiota bacterium]
MKRQSFLLFPFLLTGALQLAEAGPSQSQWPGWLGPNRNGQVSKVKTPDPWPASLKRIWNVEVGEGYASPLVEGKRIYQHARIGSEEVVSCLDLATGKLHWRQGEDVYFTIGDGGQPHGKGPKATPCLADGMIFTHGIAGKLTARKTSDGTEVWSNDFRKRFKKNRPYWGASYSPVADGGRVYVHPGHDNDGALLSLDAKTGKQIWSSEVVGPSYSSPFVLDLGGVRQIVEWNHEDLVGLNAETGQVLWRFHFPHRGNRQNTPTPIFHQGRMIVGGENRGIRSLE